MSLIPPSRTQAWCAPLKGHKIIHLTGRALGLHRSFHVSVRETTVEGLGSHLWVGGDASFHFMLAGAAKVVKFPKSWRRRRPRCAYPGGVNKLSVDSSCGRTSLLCVAGVTGTSPAPRRPNAPSVRHHWLLSLPAKASSRPSSLVSISRVKAAGLVGHMTWFTAAGPRSSYSCEIPSWITLAMK